MRKIYYNITITRLLVAVAPLIGSVELGLFSWQKGFWNWVSNLDFNAVDYTVIDMFVIAWAAGLALRLS